MFTQLSPNPLFNYFNWLQVWVAQNPPGFAFVEYERESDAEEAVRQMNGNSIPGTSAKLRVEHSRYVEIGLIFSYFIQLFYRIIYFVN